LCIQYFLINKSEVCAYNILVYEVNAVNIFQPE
jgi:hypothetical protein